VTFSHYDLRSYQEVTKTAGSASYYTATFKHEGHPLNI